MLSARTRATDSGCVQICSSLTPGDLLHVAALSRAFYNLLGDGSANTGKITIWKTARRAHGWPDLKSGDVSEKQYAYLVWGTDCQASSAHPPRTPFLAAHRLTRSGGTTDVRQVDAAADRLFRPSPSVQEVSSGTVSVLDVSLRHSNELISFDPTACSDPTRSGA